MKRDDFCSALAGRDKTVVQKFKQTKNKNSIQDITADVVYIGKYSFKMF